MLNGIILPMFKQHLHSAAEENFKQSYEINWYSKENRKKKSAYEY